MSASPGVMAAPVMSASRSISSRAAAGAPSKYGLRARPDRVAAAVANGTDEVFRASRLRLSRSGGQGAVREFAELLLKARGEWDGLVESYVASREQEHPA